MAEREIWFEYSRSAGRLTAIPVNTAGWLVLFTALVAPICLTLTLGLAVLEVHPALFALVLVLSLCSSLAVLLAFVVRKGRPRS